jgi:hypothetical protein
MENYLNTFRFFNEHVYKDIPEPKQYNINYGRYTEHQVVINYTKNNKLVTEFTPISELDGWAAPWPGNDVLYFSVNSIDRTENLLKQYYGKTRN